MTFLTIDQIQNRRGPLSECEIEIAQAAIDALDALLENWLKRTLVDRIITDERHVVNAIQEDVQFNYGPVKRMISYRLGGYSINSVVSDPYITEFYHDLVFRRGEVYYVTYETDSSQLRSLEPAFRELYMKIVVGTLMQPEEVRYGVISSYSVEGLSINYSTFNSSGTNGDGMSLSKSVGLDLSAFNFLRRRVH